MKLARLMKLARFSVNPFKLMKVIQKVIPTATL